MVATTNAIAKIAAAVAGLGLVAMSFASFAAPAKAASVDDLQAQINALLAQIASLQGGSASASATFTMDMTLGSSGAEVTALQNWLISKGYSIPAGATGYFGAQTQSALAAYQAANGISPAAGYFGPITRAKVNAAAGGSSTGGTSTGGLSGGEADLRSFDLTAGDTLREGDSNSEIAIAKFDVRGGDARLQRVTLEFTPQDNSSNEHPWEYVDSLAVYDGSKKIGDVDAGSKSDWTKEDADSEHGNALDYYTIDIAVDDVVSEGDNVELSIRADAQSSIDSSDLTNQSFDVDIDDNGIRAVDSKGIQQYTGDTTDTVTLDFDSQDNGDLTVRKASDTPTAGTLVVDDVDTSDEYDVLKFQIKNSQSGDALVTDLTARVATSSSAGSGKTVADIIRKATLTVDGDSFSGDINNDGTIDFDNIDVTVDGDDTSDFTLSVELFGQNHYNLPQTLTFSVASTDVQAEGSDSGDALTGGDLSGTATGYGQTLALNGGITVEGNDMNAVQTYNSNSVTSSYGTFTLKFDVTANGDDVFVPKQIATSASTTAGVVVDPNMASTTTGTITASLTTTADSDNGSFYVVHDGDTETFTATVTINPNGLAADVSNFEVGLDKVRFSTDDAEPVTSGALQTVDVDQSDSDFHTDPITIAG